MNNSDTQPEDDFIKMLDKHFDHSSIQYSEEERENLIKKLAEAYEQKEEDDDFVVLMDKATEFPKLALSNAQRDAILTTYLQAQSIVIAPSVFSNKPTKKRYVTWALAASIVLLFSLLFILRHEPKSKESITKQIELIEENKIEETLDLKPPSFSPPHKNVREPIARRIGQPLPSFTWNDIPALPPSTDFSLKVDEARIGMNGNAATPKESPAILKKSNQILPEPSDGVSVNSAVSPITSPKHDTNQVIHNARVPYNAENTDAASFVERKKKNEVAESKKQTEAARDLNGIGNQPFINSLTVESLTRLPSYYKEHLGSLLLIMPHVANLSSNYGMTQKNNHQLISDDLMMHYSIGAGFYKLQKDEKALKDHGTLTITSEQIMFDVSLSKRFADSFYASMGLYLGEASGGVDNYFYIPAYDAYSDADYDMDILKCYASLLWQSNPWHLSANYSYTSYNSDVYSHYLTPGSHGPWDITIDEPFEGSIQHVSLNAAYKTSSRYINHTFYAALDGEVVSSEVDMGDGFGIFEENEQLHSTVGWQAQMEQKNKLGFFSESLGVFWIHNFKNSPAPLYTNAVTQNVVQTPTKGDSSGTATKRSTSSDVSSLQQQINESVSNLFGIQGTLQWQDPRSIFSLQLDASAMQDEMDSLYFMGGIRGNISF